MWSHSTDLIGSTARGLFGGERGGGGEIVEKTSQEALLQSVDFNNLGMITSLPSLTYVDMQALSQVTTRARGTQQHCMMRV